MQHYAGLDFFRVYTGRSIHVIHVPRGQGEEVRAYLRGQGVASVMSPGTPAAYERIEVDRRVNAEALQAVLDQQT